MNMKIVTQNLSQTWCHHMLMHFSIKHWLLHRCIQVLAIGTKNGAGHSTEHFWLFLTCPDIYMVILLIGDIVGYSGVIIGERK